MASHNSSTDDPCKDFGPVQKWALVWFFSVILVGVALVYNLSRIDRFMYDSNAEFFDYQAYHENRLSQATLRGDSVDPRSHGDSVSVLRRGQMESKPDATQKNESHRDGSHGDGSHSETASPNEAATLAETPESGGHGE